MIPFIRPTIINDPSIDMLNDTISCTGPGTKVMRKREANHQIRPKGLKRHDLQVGHELIMTQLKQSVILSRLT